MDRLKELRIDRSERPAKPAGRGRWLLVAVLLLVAAGAVGAWWWSQQNRHPLVLVAVAERIDRGAPTSDTVLDASGYVTARRQATVSSKVTGKIVEVLVEEGMVIKEGQLLARLDDSLVSRQLALAKAELDASQGALAETEVRLAEAERNLSRSRELVTARVESQAALDTAQAEVDALRARIGLGHEQVTVAERVVALRQQELDDTEIRAPFAGVVVTKDAQPGEMISPVSAGGGFTRTGVCTLVDMASLEIEVDVNEAYINRVEPGQRVEATLDAYPDWKIPAAVIITVPTADRQKATVQVRIGFDRLDRRILPDMGIKVSFLAEPSSEEVAGAGGAETGSTIAIPAEALRRDGERDVVFVLAGDTVERRAVAVARRGDRVEIEAGLEVGEQVVVEGPDDLADGDRVRLE